MPSQPAEVPTATAVATTPEPVRVLVPSPIGPLGVEFYGQVIGRLVVGPAAKERRLFHPLAAFENSDFLDEVFGRISEYFAGARRTLDLEYDPGPTGADAFVRRVLRETARTPYGKTRTYKDIADASGRPEGYRQVLSILLNNPLPLLVPCHRIIPTKEGIGSWVGGAAKKRWLLRVETDAAAAGL